MGQQSLEHDVLGARDPEGAAPAFVALLDGFAVHRVARPRPREEEMAMLRDANRSLFIAAIMPPAERAAWEERMRRSVRARAQ